MFGITFQLTKPVIHVRFSVTCFDIYLSLETGIVRNLWSVGEKVASVVSLASH